MSHESPGPDRRGLGTSARRAPAKQPLRVLIVYDCQEDTELLVRELSRGGFDIAFERVDTPEAMAEALARSPWDLIISDYAMPRFSAHRALAVAKESKLDLPFITVSNTVDEEIAVEAIKAGAHDFVTKGQFARLVPAIHRELKDAAVRAERAKIQERLHMADRLASIGTLAAGIAHDFNNILGAIMAFATFVRDETEEGDSRRADIEEVLAATQRGVGLTRQLLTFCQQQPSVKQPTDLRESLARLQKMLARAVGANIELVIEPSPAPACVLIDPVQFDQIMLNLAVNARDAMPDGGRLRVKLAVRRDEPEARSGTAVLTVSDNGIGMSEAVRARAFEPFFTTKQPGKGTGLGLATCFGIIDEAGGQIRVESELGRGTVFVVELPLCEGAPELSADQDTLAHAGQGELVLLAEDDPVLRRTGQRVLEAAGYKVQVVEDGNEAVRRIDELGKRLDVLVSDVIMPGRSGYDLADHLQTAVPNAAIVLTSGHAGDAGVRNFRADLRVLWKPWSPQKLLRAVGDALAERGGTARTLHEASTSNDRILVVAEDEPTLGALVAPLSLAGYSVENATTIADAKRVLMRGHGPRFILCDLALVEGTSIELVDWIRSTLPELCPRVFLLQEDGIDGPGRALVNSGAFRVLSKPISDKKLLDRLAGMSVSSPPPALSRAGSLPPSSRLEVSRPIARGRVLLADDDAVLAAGSARKLADEGFEVVVVGTLGEAARALDVGMFDALVLDVVLPDGNGFDLVSRLRDARVTIPVVMITGKPSVESAAIAVRGQVNEYLAKPFAPDELARAVLAAVESGRVASLRDKLLAAHCGGDEFVRDLPGTEQSFARALQNIQMVYQPIVRCTDGSVFGYESLLRCGEPTLASPLRLLAAAEVLGRVSEVGNKVRACVAATILARRDCLDSIFLNIHPSELSADLLLAAGDPLLPLARRVVLEVTERASIQAGAKLDEELGRLREYGYRFAVDDLGEGYAGLSSLVSLRPDIAKIDMSLVRGIDRAPLKRDIVAALMDMARRSNIMVIAEGVETVAERDTLAEVGCELLQGYLFAKPGPPFPVARTVFDPPQSAPTRDRT